jgi:hypothetical protein
MWLHVIVHKRFHLCQKKKNSDELAAVERKNSDALAAVANNILMPLHPLLAFLLTMCLLLIQSAPERIMR